MADRADEKNLSNPSRRDFIKKSAVAGLALGAASLARPYLRKAVAAPRDHFLVGHPFPGTGGMAGFGEATPWVEDRAVEVINKQGGIYIEEYGKQVPLKIMHVDTESDDTKAAEIAAKLILQDKVDLMMVLHGPPVVNPVTAICERDKMPCVVGDNPVEAWMVGGPYHWSFHACWTVDSLINVFIGLWESLGDKTNKVVGFLFPNDPDGVEWAKTFSERLPPRGFKIVDPGRFPFFMKDYTSIISSFKKEKVEILTGCVIPPDWSTAWRQCHQQGFFPKVATVGKALLFPSAVEALGGSLPNGLTTEEWWSRKAPFKSSLTGESPEDLCAAWEAETKKQWVQPIGAKHCAMERLYDTMKRAKTLDKEKIRQALAATDLDTIMGHIKYNEKNYSETPLVIGQWVKGEKFPWDLKVVYNKQNPHIPLEEELLFPIPQ